MAMRAAMMRSTWMAILALAAFAAQAQRMEGSRASAQGAYAAEVSVRSQSAAERDNGFARALIQVLGRITGERAPQQLPGVGEEVRNAKDYVAGYDYRQDEGVSPTTGAPTYGTTLVVRFKPDKVDELASQIGVVVWPNPRPKPVLWLALDDGSGPRLVALPQAGVARSVLDRAKALGFGLGLPRGTAAEQAIVGAIWRGDTGAVARLSKAYSPPMQLIGKIQRAGPGWKADWIFVDNGRVAARDSDSDSDARRAIASGADAANDALTRKYVRRGPVKRVVRDQAVSLAFSGIDNAQGYLTLVGYLERHPQVGRIAPESAAPGSVVFALELKEGLASFRRTAAREGVIAAIGEDEDGTQFDVR